MTDMMDLKAILTILGTATGSDRLTNMTQRGGCRFCMINKNDAHTEDDHGRTSLSWAAERGHQGLMKSSLEEGAAQDSMNDKGKTPLIEYEA